MSKRALRRHHRARMIARALPVIRRQNGAYEPDNWRGPPESPDFERYDDRAARAADHLKVCSCEHCGCGNPRRWRGSNGPTLTVQELRVAGDLREQLEEVGDE